MGGESGTLSVKALSPVLLRDYRATTPPDAGGQLATLSQGKQFIQYWVGTGPAHTV
jgi:hypothetical protein